MAKESRILFEEGMQRKFLQLVLKNLSCVSLRALRQFGFTIPYGTLKCYYTEKRLLPQSFFDQLCYLGKIDAENFHSTVLNGNWGQVKGGNMRVGKKKKGKKV
ncbi:MAG: hypothetical protein RL557_880 [archaeon]|jgi:hypothetical protein